ncbi:hypothetical protein FWK35_00022078 [Aphis craccivora]|uniref:BESS domain-containing protein n=1 Tax=Aphis craccivora TaxID=307492 RepID=A0A6G0VZ90_APHCR|nr:hypothetical protein FWK35_00022078 [Aphis craccivora]
MSSIETSLDNTITELQTDNDRNDSESLEFASNTCTPTLLDAIKNPFHRSIETEDADKAFLMSFSPEIKNLNPEQKSEFQFQFHQCVRNISQYNNVPQYNPSSTTIKLNINTITYQLYTTYHHHSYYPISNNFTPSTDQTPPQSQGYSSFPDPSN